MIKLIKNSGMYKDFGKPFFKVGSEALINYKGIIVALFGTISLELYPALTIV